MFGGPFSATSQSETKVTILCDPDETNDGKDS